MVIYLCSQLGLLQAGITSHIFITKNTGVLLPHPFSLTYAIVSGFLSVALYHKLTPIRLIIGTISAKAVECGLSSLKTQLVVLSATICIGRQLYLDNTKIIKILDLILIKDNLIWVSCYKGMFSLTSNHLYCNMICTCKKQSLPNSST